MKTTYCTDAQETLTNEINLSVEEMEEVIAPALTINHNEMLISKAIALKQDAVAYLESQVGTFVAVPRVLYCSSAACAKSYGFSSQGAYTVGSYGIVVGPRGWQPHFVRHELIHHLQVERWGSLRTWLLKPDWLIEGMAYSLSEDPRHPLPEPLQGWRQKFEEWHATAHEGLWTEADKQ